MEEKLIKDLLSRRQEEDWFDFKREWKLYQADGKPNEYQRDELIKDVLGMANGNSHIVRKTKHLIIGADDSNFAENGLRILHNVDYRVPTQKEITDWVKGASEPAVTGIECVSVIINDSNVYVISISPTFDLHETKRDLNTPKRFGEHTVFMRQGDNTIPASVREGVEIQQLKQSYRHEVANPSAAWLSALVGALVTFLLWDAESRIKQDNPALSGTAVLLVAVIVGSILGWEIGWLVQQFNRTRYDWRYWTHRERTGVVLSVLMIFLLMYFWQIRK